MEERNQAVDYEVFASTSLATVRIQVQALLQQGNGWRPQGPIVVEREKNKTLYLQALVRWE